MTQGGDGSIVINPLGAPCSTPLYLCLPPIQGSASGDCYFPTKCGHICRSLVKINPLNTRTLLYRGKCTVLLRMGRVLLVDHPRQLASPANQRKICQKKKKKGKDSPNVRHLQMEETLQRASTSGILMQLIIANLWRQWVCN